MVGMDGSKGGSGAVGRWEQGAVLSIRFWQLLGLGVPPLPLWAHGAAGVLLRGPSFGAPRVQIEPEALFFAFFGLSPFFLLRSTAGSPGASLFPPQGENVDRSDTLTDKRTLFSQVVKSLKFAPETQMAGGTDKRKQSLYFPEKMLKAVQDE